MFDDNGASWPLPDITTHGLKWTSLEVVLTASTTPIQILEGDLHESEYLREEFPITESEEDREHKEVLADLAWFLSV